ncbi:hypothetical protein RND81_11G087800 [Saponaria officinalis]|uniref:Uncharacterized protein n=1 Tax=Saponaria officinalis TaxID=3572 RepID=A0AAW1HJQ7_SAPOF
MCFDLKWLPYVVLKVEANYRWYSVNYFEVYVGRETTTEEVGVEAWTCTIVTVPLVQNKARVLKEVLLLAVHLCLEVAFQTGAVLKDILFLLAVLCLSVEAHHMGGWTTHVAPLLVSQSRLINDVLMFS